MPSRSRRRSGSRNGCCRLTPAKYCKLVALSKGTSKRSKRGRSRRSRRGKRRSRTRSRRHSRRSSRRRSRRSRSRRSRSRRGGSRRGRSRRGKSRKGRCHRPGPKTNNPFLNYMRVFRKKKCGWPASKIAIEGAKCWCKMKQQDRMRFYKEACSMLKHRGRSRRRKGRGKRKRSRRRKSSRKRSGCP